MSGLGSLHRQLPLLSADAIEPSGSARISAYWHLPEVLQELGVELREVLETAAVHANIFDDRENRIAYPELGRLLLACEQLTGCEHIALLISQHTRLVDFGLAGQIALCADTVGEGLQRFVDSFNLHNTAATISVITSGGYTRLVYAITVHDMTGTRHFQLGAVAMAFNILQDLCGSGWLPAVVTLACRAPSSLRPCHKFFRAPLRFDSEESALVFARHWLDRPLPPVDPRVRHRVEAEVHAQRNLIMADFLATMRRVLRRQLLVGECSMDHVATLLGMHRRTLDRHLQKRGVRYGTLLESVKDDVARQLLRDTDMKVQQIAETLHFSSAANFATAFRRWRGVTPSTYRREAR